MASGAQQVNANAEVLKKGAAHQMNINAARGLQDVLKTNLGPKGTLKMLVSGAGDIKLTKDGNTLLHEMQIQHPTAMMIARIATAQDDITGDGTTSAVLIVGELMKQAERHLTDGVHPRLICEGIELAKERVLAYIDKSRVEMDTSKRELLVQIAQASLRTKMHQVTGSPPPRAPPPLLIFSRCSAFPTRAANHPRVAPPFSLSLSLSAPPLSRYLPTVPLRPRHSSPPPSLAPIAPLPHRSSPTSSPRLWSTPCGASRSPASPSTCT